MSAGNAGETKSYKDRTSGAVQAVLLENPRYESRFPDVNSIYDGFYFMFSSTDKRSASFLAGGEGIIGLALKLAFDDEGLSILARDGSVVARIEGQAANRLREHHDKGWVINAALATTLYHEKEKRFAAEVACLCFDAEFDETHSQALTTFTKNIIGRINAGLRPALELEQQQLDKVIESKGAWYLTKNTPSSPKEKGMMYYKRRRTWADYLVVAAMNGNIGCQIANIVFWIGLVAAIAFAVWWFIIR
ncbi:MAG: hypothetical protein FWD43_01840 [Coriobacteriia bacterium]|nr:hypothetical protein [Coriobacteriia bacterium]